MNCSKCATALPEGSAFCNKCGAALNPLAAPPAAAPSQEPEQELWKGRFSSKAFGHLWLLWFAELGILAYLWLGVVPPGVKSSPLSLPILGALAGLPLLAILWSTFLQKISVRYRLTTHRLFKECGILSRQMNEIELIRVDDVSVRQNLVQRIFNVGVITVIAPTDQTEPRLELVGIENPIEVKEQIRGQVRKRRDKSIHMETL
jgi:membrane protein YdbS with pleckstrin-like domain